GITDVGPLFPTERTLFGSIQINAWCADGFFHFSKYGGEYKIRDATVCCDDVSRETRSPEGPKPVSRVLLGTPLALERSTEASPSPPERATTRAATTTVATWGTKQ
ncbi:unnamed protein product, partial [Discosporangium mesarthrocarpum]